ncbi:AraC family transcriptional regulator [Methylocapsa sp. S129]|uniref:AraC family transcriptional regulator n=1 Tax=Methylocapsa sp. S129 TaxID=1641869 RepID=UPI00131D9C57|nr:AraC family transcriptional regulator [Methylocapsa sp. S129]
MRSHGDCRQDFLNTLGRPFLGEELFDRIADTVFFLKDRDARYVAVNDALVRRCALASKADLIGRTAREVFPAPLGERFDDQDRRVLKEGLSINGRLELHLYPDRRQGWCLTWKEPLSGRDGKIVGLSGISRDVPTLTSPQPDVTALSSVLGYIHDHLDASLRLPDLAARARLSVFQFDQRIKALFGLSAGQYLTRARIERACNRLRQTDDPISIVAQECGYADQAAFTRQFHKSAGLTPKAYRSAMTRDRRQAPGQVQRT